MVMLDSRTLSPGQEQFELFWSETVKRKLVRYDYRACDGELFSCVAVSVATARAKRAIWLRGGQQEEKNHAVTV